MKIHIMGWRISLLASTLMLVACTGENKEDLLNDTNVETTASTLIAIDPNGCTDVAPCDAGGGDCDRDSQCTAGNVCGNNNGTAYGTYYWWDICEPVACAGCDDGPCGACDSGEEPGSQHYCSDTFPCASENGDCDSDAQCQGGLICHADAGHGYELPAWTDMCAPACSADNPPTALAGFNYNINVGDSVTLDGSFSSDPDEGCGGGDGDRILLYEWRIGAGGSFTDVVTTNSTVLVPWEPKLRQLGVGNHTVEVRVWDQAGNSDTHIRQLNITEPEL